MKNYIFVLISTLCLSLSYSQDALNLSLLDHWTDTSLQKGAEEARFNDLWVFQWDEINYVVVGSTFGAHFFEIRSDSLIHLTDAKGKYSAPNVVHRDFKTYKNYLYAVCDEGTSSLQIFDVSYLPDSVHKVFDSDQYFTICHNIFIDTTYAKLYACGPNDIGMKVFDISTPALPLLTHDFNYVNYVHDCYVRDQVAFLNCGFDGLQIWNFSSPQAIQVGVLDFYPNQGYNHSGWLSPDAKKYLFIDETEGTKVKMCRYTHPSQIKIDAVFGSDEYENNVPHNVICSNQLAFVAYYNEGLRIYDLGRSPIKEIARYDTFWQETNYKLNGAWGVGILENENQVLVIDRQNGLFLFEFPIEVFENNQGDVLYSSTVFVNSEGIIIPRNYLEKEDIYFSISDVNGNMVYEKESMYTWMNIPLNLAPGIYVFGVFSAQDEILETGKFIVL